MPRSSSIPSPWKLVLIAAGGAMLLLLGWKGWRRTLPPLPPAAPPLEARQEIIGRSVEGRPLTCYVWGDGARSVLIMASIHGTEGAGTPLVEKLMEWLPAHREQWAAYTVWVLPVANPDGLAARQRFNARGIDLNRNFPAANREDNERFGLTPLSEPESQALAALIERIQPEWIVSIHQPLNCVDYDGPEPAATLAERLAAGTGLPVKKLGARPGSLGAWFGETLGRPILTLELPPLLHHDPDDLWARYGEGLTQLLTTQ